MVLAAALALSMSYSTLLPQDSHLDWWREAKFGMFIHWGLYAVPAGEWEGRTNHAEWIRDTARIPVKTYEQFLAQFNPVKFDPDAWAKMAKDAGMKYLVITSKHHDGFCLYDSKFTDWDVASTPYKKDILRMLKEACDRQGIRFATYHSIMDWHHPDYLPRRGWEAADRPSAGADFKRFVQYLHHQVEEIATQYDPAIMWFDGQWEGTWNTDLGKDLLALCRRVRPDMIVNNRVNSGPQGGGDYLTPEQEIPEEAIHGKDWETCMTLNNNWGYNKADRNTKSTKQVIQMLADIASKGGNYLLNIGPTAEGEFPAESVQRLKEIGAWMRTNGDSIYGTKASPFGKLPWGRCTMKSAGGKATLYLHVFEWPKDGRLRLPGLGNDVLSATMLDGGAPVKTTRDDADVVLGVPDEAPDAMNSVVVVEIDGAPIVYKAPKILAEASQFVKEITIEMEPMEGLDIRFTVDGRDPGPRDPRIMGTLTLRRSMTVKARAFHGERPVSSVTEMRFEKVEPKPAKAVTGQAPGLVVQVFLGDWDRVPDFKALSASSSKSLPTVSIADDAQREFCGRLFRGLISVQKDELYRFALASDDGSRLWIDGQLVVDNDGLHGMVEKTGSAALAKGLHEIEIGWFNKTGGAGLSLKWAELGEPLAEVPAGSLFHLPPK